MTCKIKLSQYLLLTVLLLLAAFVINAYSVVFGSIKGKLTDRDTGLPVVSAVIKVIGTDISTITNSKGEFELTGLKTGLYDLKIEHKQLGSTLIKAVSVQISMTTTVVQQIEFDKIGKTDKSTEDEIGSEESNRQGKKNNSPLKITSDVDSKSSADKTNVALATTQEQSAVVGPKSLVRVKKEKRLYEAEGYISYNPYLPAHGGTAIVNGEAFDAMFFKNHGVNPFVDTEDDNLSTFAIDVDDASFIMTRSYLDRNALVPSDAVRSEEFINYFDYGYEAPHNEPFKVFLEGAPSRFGKNSRLLKIGIKGMEVNPEDRKDANLVFVIDISGSMGREDRLGLVKKSLLMLVEQLNRKDKIGIVVYGSNGYVLLKPTSIKKKKKIIDAISSLSPGGSTNAEEGIRLGYKMAEKMFDSKKINRIILCSDGVANVGTTGPDEIQKQIKKYADQGITLSTVGFGMGNYNDILMEKLGNKGNGSYAYVDNLNEAHRIFVENLTGNLQVIARDVKIQVDFNPDVVRSYRLIGYENRDVDDAKFRDDKEDGGEIGAGHEVTALYEIKLHKNVSGRQMGRVFIRYKDANNNEVNEINRVIKSKYFADEFEDASQELRLAACAAEFGEILRNSYWARSSNIEDVIIEVSDLLDDRRDEQIIELIEMLAKYKKLENKLAKN
jgi:Ca-activated chloride channel family protein